MGLYGIKIQFNPSTLKALYNPVTEKVQCVSICGSPTRIYTVVFEDVVECVCAGLDGWPEDLNKSWELEYKGIHAASYHYWEYHVGDATKWYIQLFCKIATVKTFVLASFLDTGVMPDWELAFCSTLSFDATKNNIWILGDCCNYGVCRILDGKVIGHSGMVTVS